MSVRFNWEKLVEKNERTEEMIGKMKKMVENELNRLVGSEDKDLQSTFKVLDLGFGSDPPVVRILDIVSLSPENIELVFQLQYSGNSFIDLSNEIKFDLETTMSPFQKFLTNNRLTNFLFGTESHPDMPFIVKIHDLKFNTNIRVRMFCDEEKRKKSGIVEYDCVSIQLEKIDDEKTVFSFEIQSNFEKAFPTMGKMLQNRVIGLITRIVDSLIDSPRIVDFQFEESSDLKEESKLHKAVNYKIKGLIESLQPGIVKIGIK